MNKKSLIHFKHLPLLKMATTLSFVVSSVLYASTSTTPDTGNILIQNQQPTQLPTTLKKTAEQSGFTVVASVLVDNASIVESSSPNSKLLQTVKKGDKIKLNGLEENGYYGVQDGGFISKKSVEIVTKIKSVTVSHRGEVRIEDALVQKVFAHYTKDGVTADSMDEALGAVKYLGGIDAAVFLKPNGESYDATLGLVEAKPFSAYVGEDNYGDHTTGVFRTSLGASLNDKFGYGEKISASVITTGKDLLMGTLQASVPVGNDAGSVNVGVSHMNYSLGDAFTSLDATGVTTSFWAGYNKPLWLSYKGSLVYDLKISRNMMVDQMGAFNTTTKRASTTMENSLSFVRQDSFMGGGSNGAYLNLKLGRLETSAVDTYDEEGSYAKVNLSLQRVQKLGSFTAIALVQGQKAFRNLDSSEKFNLTGINGVGGYYTGDIVGDEGVLASLEVDHAIPKINNLIGGIIYTNGTARNLYSPIAGSGENIQKASSMGYKLSYAMPYDISASAGLYKRVSGENTTDYNNPYHFLFNIAKKF
jgi:hemolysin activation/secretion protein